LKWKYIGQIEQAEKYMMDIPEYSSQLKIDNVFEKIIEPKRTTGTAEFVVRQSTVVEPRVVMRTTATHNRHIRF
jgi:hypothetical protein